MKLNKTLLSFCLLTSSLAQAIETDQFAAWTLGLNDSSTLVETYFKRHIDTVVEEVNQRPFISNNCASVAQEVSELLSQATSVPGITSIEEWLVGVPAIQRMPQQMARWNSSGATIYDGYWRFKYIPFGSTLNVHGVLLGADKIGHFTELGMSYFKKVRELLAQGVDYDKAVKSAIGYGVYLEYNIYGLYTSRVFSFADLEANYQGLKFYENLCTNGDHAHLAFDSEKMEWKFKNRRKFTLKPFINPNWDESHNISHYSPALWSLVLPRIRAKCELLKHSQVQARFADYKVLSRENTNQMFLRHLRKQGKIPAKTFSDIQSYCAQASEL